MGGWGGKRGGVAGRGQPGSSGGGGPGTKAQRGRVFGLGCRTDAGMYGLYISDSDNGAVRVLDHAGIINTWFSGFSFPTGIVEVPNSNVADVVVSDSGRDNALWELAGGSFGLVAGIPRHAGYSGDNGPATSPMLSDPQALALTGTWLFAPDRGHNRARLFTPTPPLIIPPPH